MLQLELTAAGCARPREFVKDEKGMFFCDSRLHDKLCAVRSMCDGHSVRKRCPHF